MERSLDATALMFGAREDEPTLAFPVPEPPPRAVPTRSFAFPPAAPMPTETASLSPAPPSPAGRPHALVAGAPWRVARWLPTFAEGPATFLAGVLVGIGFALVMALLAGIFTPGGRGRAGDAPPATPPVSAGPGR